jgi:FlaG/FlaF family flagellin (archaellin)
LAESEYSRGDERDLVQADRAVTSTVSVALLVAILAVLAAVVGTSVLDFADTVEDPAPTVAQSTGSFEPQD